MCIGSNTVAIMYSCKHLFINLSVKDPWQRYTFLGILIHINPILAFRSTRNGIPITTCYIVRSEVRKATGELQEVTSKLWAVTSKLWEASIEMQAASSDLHQWEVNHSGYICRYHKYGYNLPNHTVIILRCLTYHHLINFHMYVCMHSEYQLSSTLLRPMKQHNINWWSLVGVTPRWSLYGQSLLAGHRSLLHFLVAYNWSLITGHFWQLIGHFPQLAGCFSQLTTRYIACHNRKYSLYRMS